MTNNIRSIIASLANVPMTLESGLSFGLGSWDRAESTRFLMENSPFFITMTSNGGIELTNAAGNWLARTSAIVEAKSFDNGYCYFMTENGHKYQFTTFENTPVVQQKWMEKPVTPVIKQYETFDDLPFKEKVYFEEYKRYYVNSSQNKYHFGQLDAKRADYGFTKGGIFCHISDSKERITSLLNFDGLNVIGELIKNSRGYKLCNYVFEGDERYSELMLSLEADVQDHFLKGVNDCLKSKIELDYNSALKQYNQQMEIHSILGFHAVNIKHESDHRAYCDSKTTSIFEFSRPISREEFSSFLKEMNMKEMEKGDWYTPYTIIKGEGDKWTYTLVSPYTD